MNEVIVIMLFAICGSKPCYICANKNIYTLIIEEFKISKSGNKLFTATKNKMFINET